MSEEKAVDAGQVSQPAQTVEAQVSTAYYEPHHLADLARGGRLYLVADGLSGLASGLVASQYAVRKIIHAYYHSSTSEPQKRLLEVIEQTNREIFERNAQHPERRPLATTLTAALIHDSKLLVANVGDNQAFVVWDQDIEQLKLSYQTNGPAKESDASVLLLPSQTSPPEKATETAPPDSFRERMLHGLGLEKTVKIETCSRRLFPGDIVVICNGGLTGYLQEKEIVRAVNTHPPEQAIRRLMALADERGHRGQSAISVTRLLSSPVSLRPPNQMTLPSAPKWSDWDNLPRDVAAGPKAADKVDGPGFSSTSTQPLPQPPMRTAPLAPPLPPPKPRRMDWKVGVAAIIVLLTLCGLARLAAQYFIPAETLAAVPVVGSYLVQSPEAPANATPAMESAAESAEAGTGTVASPASVTTPGVTVTAPLAPDATLVVAGNSPVATPPADTAAALVSPVGRPTTTASDVIFVSTPTAIPTPAATIVLPAGCTNRARFMGDVTIPDGTEVTPGQSFEKIWNLLNAETCPWGPGYTLRFVAGDQMGAPAIIPLLDVIAAKATGEIALALTAPSSVGKHRSEWQLHDLNGEAFGPDLYLEIEVVPPDLTDLDNSQLNVLFDFVENAGRAIWSSEDTSYIPLETGISEELELALPDGLVATGLATLRGSIQSDGKVLLTYPHQQYGFTEGRYTVDSPLQPTDSLILELGFPKLGILSDDGVTFEVTFTPTGGEEQLLLSTPVQYADSPVTEVLALSAIQPGQTGAFTLRVLSGDSARQDWALWISARLIRPE